MYSLPKLVFRFPAVYAALGFLIALFSTAVVTYIAVNRDLRLTPAVLMRPKAPKKGKRIFLERFTGFWSHLSFTAKVTARNLFRNKSRFSMTLVGIAGCTAMLLASLGFYNSISAIKSEQFDNADAIAKYDLQVVFDRAQTSPNHTAEYNTASSDGRISDMCLISLSSMTGFSDRTDAKLDVYVMVPEMPGKMPLFIDMRDRKTHEAIELNNSGAVITEKLAKDTDTKVGDDISFSDASGHIYTVNVSAIAENYTFHYIYLTPTVYNAVTGSAPTYSYAIGNISPSLKEGQIDMESLKGLLAGDLMRIDGVTTVAYLSETTKSIGEITKALSAVILVFFFSALILAFVVLYNLANINIIERTRELATLKVLGFNDSEINRYILRENIVVSLFGILFGIGFGLILHRLLITFTAIDTVMYGQRIYWYSYVVAVGITILFIAGVNLLLHRKTARIDMVESLKSVE
jgi:putative ABC transport system permease protein